MGGPGAGSAVAGAAAGGADTRAGRVRGAATTARSFAQVCEPIEAGVAWATWAGLGWLEWTGPGWVGMGWSRLGWNGVD